MDVKVEKVCPNCSQYFTLPGETKRGKICRLPLTLHCGHPICQDCLLGIVKYSVPIECKVCHNMTTLAPNTGCNFILEEAHLIYETFPIHVHVLGELSMKLLESAEMSQMYEEDNLIDEQSILESNKNVSKCAECPEETDKMCQNCGSALCESCFNEIHSKYQSFKKHVYKEIELKLEANMCEVHTDKPISCYCNNCSKCRCIDCLILTTNGENCKSHEVVPLSQMHGKYVEELNAVSPKVDETLKHISNTAAQIGDTLKSYEQSSNVCEISQMMLNVQNHFTRVYATVQKHEHETIAVLEKLKIEQMQSLLKAKENVFAHIKKTERIIDSISALLHVENVDEEIVTSNEDEDDSLTPFQRSCSINLDPVDTSGWLPSGPFPTYEFYGWVTCVDESGVFYVCKENYDTRQLLRSIIELEKYNCGKIEEGALCLARKDQQLHRGQIKEIKPNYCMVLFVDYGNVDGCIFEDIVVLPKATSLHNIPIQVRKCVVANIKPVEGTWSAEAMDYIHQILYTKMNYIVVVGHPIGQFVPVEIKVENEYWLHENLVENGFAVESADWRDFVESIED